VADRNISLRDKLEARIVVRDNAKHLRPGRQTLNDNNADIVLVFMYQ
jgi:hypothetical protein